MAFPLFIYNPFPSSLFPCPSKPGSKAAQFRNEDRIKIFPETVQDPATHTKKATSKSVQHRITLGNSGISQQFLTSFTG
jgi:hypothetical protein